MSDLKESIIEEAAPSRWVGKSFHYENPDVLENEWLRLTTKIEDIGTDWNVAIRNNTTVVLLSDPIVIDTEKYGKIEVCNVRADVITINDEWCSMAIWMPADHMIPII